MRPHDMADSSRTQGRESRRSRIVAGMRKVANPKDR
jgi:hypothetical protein